MKKILAMILALCMVFALCACGAEEAPAEVTQAPATEAPVEEAAPAEEAAAPAEFDKSLIKDGDVLLTSIGQSGDISMMEAIFKKVGTAYTVNATATADDVKSAGVVIAVVGASSKGLGAAGISIEDELSRTNAIMAACKEAGIPVILAHVGGASRTGGSSDQLINAVLEGGASYALVVADGDVNGIFSNYCAEHNIPLTLIQSLANAVEPLTAIFG